MSVEPKGEDFRKAVKWVSEERTYHPDRKIKAIIEQACVKYDLSPMDADFLIRKFIEQDK
ncbi:MAG: hypothetical protein JSW04_12535 [Desulfobacterales bacterium]|nr:MAG: hypothetical protein JSV38_12915 [Desulfobacterales bacterium]UCD89236.1 MAG: hypothetical protein JSW04_12535 [Desulfobacterales bacterium]